MSYLKSPNDESKNASNAQTLESSGTSPPPTDFSLSSVHHHPNPEKRYKAASLETVIDPDKSLVEHDFRANFVQRQRQNSALGTKNNSAASSLTTRLSSTNFRELLNAAQAAVAVMQTGDHLNCSTSLGAAHDPLPKYDKLTNISTSLVFPRRQIEVGERNQRTNTSKAPNSKAPAISSGTGYPSLSKVSDSVITTSRETTSGIFSLSKESKDTVGEKLTSMIKGKGPIKPRLADRVEED